MKLEAALDEFGLLQRRRRAGEEGQRTAAALAVLREYLLDYAGLQETSELGGDDLFQFLLEYYPSQEEPDPEVALTLLETAAGFSMWLLERGERATASFAAAEDRLREDLPRVLEAYSLLKEQTRRDELAQSSVLLGEGERQAGEPGAEGAEAEEAPIGSIGSGLSRVARLDQIDYAAGEAEYFTLTRAGDGSLTLQSRARELLGEAPAGPVVVPERAAELLRPGDIIHAEIAPASDGWELVDVFGIRPGGYA